MELKVWVDGIKRVVCGVTDNTTCQDIVIALAQAMGRTGRFTLIEKWRENERPLAPTECPLLVLQKWGEFANEVKLMLYESGTRRKHRNSDKENSVKKPQDPFTHNFTPPVKTSEAVIRRSLTFNGPVRRMENVAYKAQDMHNFQRQNDNHGALGLGQPQNKQYLPVPDKVTSDGNSYHSSNSSLSSQNSSMMHPQHPRRRSRSSSHDRAVSHDQKQSQPYQTYTLPHSNDIHGKPSKHLSNSERQQSSHVNNPNSVQGHYNPPTTKPTHPNQQQYPVNPNVPSMNGPVRPGHRPSPVNNAPPSLPILSSAFSVVKPRHSGSEDERDTLRIQAMDIPVYTDIVRKSSHKGDNMEEYDLDSNFPDVVKETGREHLIEEYRMPGHGGQGRHRNQQKWEEEERVKLLRLVTMQTERIKMQDSQLDIIDTEIVSREQKLEDLKLEISRITEEITNLSTVSGEKEQELHRLDNGTLIDEMEAEKSVERGIKNEITSLQSRLQKCENDLRQFQSKVQVCSENLEHEQEVLKTDEKRRKEEEIKLQEELSELRKEVDVRTKDNDEKSQVYASVEEELKSISEQLNEKTGELTSTEKELQRENLKFFQHPKTTEPVAGTKPVDTNGEAVLKVLEGSSTPHVKRAKMLASPLTILELTKSKTGVWV